MPLENKLSYFKQEYPSVFSLYQKWVRYDKREGCKPLANPQAAILMEKKPPPLPGDKPAESKKSAKDKAKVPEPVEPQKSAHAVKVGGTQRKESPATPENVSSGIIKSKEPPEECRIPPPFDMLDIPDAMDRMGFVVSAKFARRWFNGRKHEFIGERGYIYPPNMIETDIVSLDAVLKHVKVRAKYDDLINKEIYSEAAIDAIKKLMFSLLEKKFVNDGIAYSGELNALAYSGGNIQKYHNEFQFQRQGVSSFDTLSNFFSLTDLTGALANFNLNAAVANANVSTEKYYNYSKATPVFCSQSTVEVTHIYVYVRDSYSFADRKGKKASQYLGHRNRNGIILVPTATAADVANGLGSDIELGNSPYEVDGFDRPVDILKGAFRQMRKQDVYYPVHNRDYLAWRQKFDRGGDFVIYTKPKKIKLPKPIKFSLQEICRPTK